MLRFLIQKRFHNKGQLNFATEVPKDFCPGAFARLCVNHDKSNKNLNFELKCELLVFFKDSSYSYGCQLRHLVEDIASPFF